MGLVDGRERRSPVYGREPAGIAMRQDLDRIAASRSGNLFQDRESLITDRLAADDVFVTDRDRFVPSPLGALGQRVARDRIDHPADGPAEVDRGRASRNQLGFCDRHCIVAWVLRERERDRVCGCCTN